MPQINNKNLYFFIAKYLIFSLIFYYLAPHKIYAEELKTKESKSHALQSRGKKDIKTYQSKNLAIKSGKEKYRNKALEKNDSNKQTQEIVAKIGKSIVTNFELKQRYDHFIASNNFKVSDTIGARLVIEQILDKIIEEKIINNHSKELNITNQNSEIEDYIKNNQEHNEIRLIVIAAQSNDNNNQKSIMLNRINNELLWQKIIRRQILPKVKVADYQVEQALEQQKLNQPIQEFLISQIVINRRENSEKESLLLAEKIYQELQNNNHNFNYIKQQLSQEVSVNIDNEELEWLSVNEINPAVLRAIENISIASYAMPVAIGNNYYIFKLIDSRLSKKIPEELFTNTKNNIAKKQLRELSNGYLINLRKKEYIEINKTALNKLINDYN
jgi:hypothetical protein